MNAMLEAMMVVAKIQGSAARAQGAAAGPTAIDAFLGRDEISTARSEHEQLQAQECVSH
jgi:hypothetical protein